MNSDPEAAYVDLLPALHRRMSRALANGRGLMLSAEDMSVLAACGALQALGDAAAAALRSLASERLAQRRGGSSEA